jgi:hypothetical protein
MEESQNTRLRNLYHKMMKILRFSIIAISFVLLSMTNNPASANVNQTFPISGTGFSVTDEIIYPGNNTTCKVEGVDSFPESTSLQLRVITEPGPWCKIRVCIPPGLLDSAKQSGFRLPFVISESVNNKVTTPSPMEVSPFAPCSNSDRELEFLLNPTGSLVDIKITGTQWLGAPIPEFPFGATILSACIALMITFYKARIRK